jgi:arachidonate 5-lipoxygenase
MPVKNGNDTYSVEKIDDLVEIVTTFVFISTVQHAAVNYQQYDSYGFIPNNPIALRGDWPRSKV